MNIKLTHPAPVNTFINAFDYALQGTSCEVRIKSKVNKSYSIIKETRTTLKIINCMLNLYYIYYIV